MRGTTILARLRLLLVRISTHVPHAGHDVRGDQGHDRSQGFQLTCPMRGTTAVTVLKPYPDSFQLTCPMRGTTAGVPFASIQFFISTHVPHAGHDGTRSAPHS